MIINKLFALKLYSDGDILVNFDVSTIDIGDTKAADIKSNIQSAMNKNDILDGFSSSDPKLSVSTFVVNGII